ncbi:MAG TPA: hypothetical protein PKA41_12440, partial [Verrucomicrobiota bacterium]|nr:hypothetical protein [Verrucomicrobiota bacterium]
PGFRLVFLPGRFNFFAMMFLIAAHVEAALELARYNKLDAGSFAGEIPRLKGGAAFGCTVRKCEAELRSTPDYPERMGFKTIREIRAKN